MIRHREQDNLADTERRRQIRYIGTHTLINGNVLPLLTAVFSCPFVFGAVPGECVAAIC